MPTFAFSSSGFPFTPFNKILSADVNTSFTDIRTFFNTTKLDDDNIQNAGITRDTKLKVGTVNALVLNNSSTGAMTELTPGTSGYYLASGGASAQPAWTTTTTISMPTGAVTPYAGSSSPTGWLLCDGTAVSRTTYSNLFAITGTTYGVGNGTTTFNVPDMRNNVPIGAGSIAARGGIGGTSTHTLVAGEMPVHSHTFTGSGHTHNLNFRSANNSPGGNFLGHFDNSTGSTLQLNTTADTISSASVLSGTEAGTNATAGGGGAHNNLQPYLSLNYIIKI